MQILSSTALARLRAGGYIGVSILVEGTGGTIILGEEDLVENSLTLDRNSVSGSQVEIGNAETSELVFDLDNSDGRFNSFVFEGAKLTVDLVIGIDSLRMGIFTVDQPPRRHDILRIIALDNMAKYNRMYTGSLAYPATLAQILQDVCTQCGVTLATSTFLNSSYSVAVRPEDITCHEIVAAIAELAGCCAWMDWNGELRLSWYADTGAELHLSDLMGSYQIAESDITITGIRYEDQDYTTGTEDYALVIEGNPLLQDNWQPVIDAIHTAIVGFTYRPWSADCKGYPHLWPLDIVSPLEDPTELNRVGIITSHKYTLGGLSSLAGVGETETLKGYATAAPFTARQKTVIQRTAEIEASSVLTPIQQMAVKMNALAAGAMGLYLTEIVQQDGSRIEYWHDSSTLAGSTYISTFTDAGFLWTNNGWNGGSPVWNYGFTNDGDALFRYLSAKGLHADWITTGRLSSVDGNTYFDLVSGTISTPGVIGANGFTDAGVESVMPAGLVFPDYFPGIQVKAFYGMASEKNILTAWFQEPAANGWPETTRLSFHETTYIGNSGLVLGTIVTQTDVNGNATATETGIFSQQNLKPFQDSTLDLGSSTRRWKDFYLASGRYIYLGSNGRIRCSDTPSMVISVTTGGTIYLRPNGDGSTTGQLVIAADGTVTLAGNNVRAVGLSTSWGATSGLGTGAINAVMGTSGGATWLWSGTSNGTFRYGMQGLDSGGNLRLYIGSSYYQFTGSALYVNTTAVSLDGHTHGYIPTSGYDNYLVTSYGSTGMVKGNGDSASEASCNLDIQSWYGIGIKGMAGNPYGNGTRTIWINARNGDVSSKGTFYAAAFSTSGTGTFDKVVAIRNVTNPTYDSSNVELRSTGGQDVALGFHRAGYTACALIHESNGLRLANTTHTGLAKFHCNELTAESTCELGPPNSGYRVRITGNASEPCIVSTAPSGNWGYLGTSGTPWYWLYVKNITFSSGAVLSGSVSPAWDGGGAFGGYSNRFSAFYALTFSSASKRELKTAIIEYDITQAYEDMRSMTPYIYQHKAGGTHKQLGVMFEDSPECIKDGDDENEGGGIDLYSYSTFIFAAVKEMQTIIDSLKSEIETLKKKMEVKV